MGCDSDLLVAVLCGTIFVLLVSGYFLVQHARLEQQVADLEAVKAEGVAAFQACMAQFEVLGLVEGVNCYTCDASGCERMNVTIEGG